MYLVVRSLKHQNEKVVSSESGRLIDHKWNFRILPIPYLFLSLLLGLRDKRERHSKNWQSEVCCKGDRLF